MGEANRFEGEVKGGLFSAGELSFPAPDAQEGPSAAFVRLHQLVLAEASEPGVGARLERAVLNGPVARLECIAADGTVLEAGASREQALGLAAGDMVRLAVHGGHVFPRG